MRSGFLRRDTPADGGNSGEPIPGQKLIQPMGRVSGDADL